jgi:hypothetical protein
MKLHYSNISGGGILRKAGLKFGLFFLSLGAAVLYWPLFFSYLVGGFLFFVGIVVILSSIFFWKRNNTSTFKQHHPEEGRWEEVD